jgi:hypothetical protein
LTFFDKLTPEDKKKYFSPSTLSPSDKQLTRVVDINGKVWAINQTVYDTELQDKDAATRKKIEDLLEENGRTKIVDPATKTDEFYIVHENAVDTVQA